MSLLLVLGHVQPTFRLSLDHCFMPGALQAYSAALTLDDAAKVSTVVNGLDYYTYRSPRMFSANLWAEIRSTLMSKGALIGTESACQAQLVLEWLEARGEDEMVFELQGLVPLAFDRFIQVQHPVSDLLLKVCDHIFHSTRRLDPSMPGGTY